MRYCTGGYQGASLAVACMLSWRQTVVKEGGAYMIMNVKESSEKVPMIGSVL